MPINVNDITFVDISELAEVEQIDGSEEIQVSESHKINLKNLISNFITTNEFAQALTQYYTKAQTYTKTELHTLLSSLNAGVDLKLESYIKDTELTTTLQNYITSTVYNNLVNQINTELSKKVTSVNGYRLLGNNELDPYSLKAETNSLLSNYVLKVPGSGLITDLERDKLTHAVDTTYIDDKLAEYSETEALQTVLSVNKDSIYDFKLWDPEKKVMLKFPVVNLLNSLSNIVLTKQVKSLIGDKNGRNDTFTCDKYILGSSRVYVNKIPQFLGRHFEELNNTSIRFFEYLPEGQDELLIEAIFE